MPNRSSKPKRVWHYTIGAYLPIIIQSGEIRQAIPYGRPNVRPVVWATVSPVWEETANKGSVRHTASGPSYVSGDRRMTAELGGGLARIELTPSSVPHNWRCYRDLSGETPHVVSGLAATARRVGSDPVNWRVSFVPIPASEWISIEHLVDGRWQPWSESSGALHG